MDELKTNVLYFGDNLDILRKYIPDNSIDLIYLDPPFNSKKDYNILFKENGGVESEAQIKAFTDTWHWTQAALGDQLGVTVNAVEKWKAGDRQPANSKAVLAMLGEISKRKRIPKKRRYAKGNQSDMV